MHNGTISRRQWLTHSSGCLLAAGLCAPEESLAEEAGPSGQEPVRLGIIADLHHHLAPDALDRLQAFMKEVEKRRPDFLIQLGDFSHEPHKSADLNDLWKSFPGPRYHVLGNHDMDHLAKRATLDAWEMKRSYYSFDRGGVHFAVLDANNLLLDGKYVDYAKGNYYQHAAARGHLTPEQLDWLAEDLARTQKPTILFTHQALDRHASVRNAAEVRRAMARINERPQGGRIVACLCGHHHIDDHQMFDSIHYLQVNSASYHWVGSQYTPGGMARYDAPLFAFMTVDSRGNIQIEGAESRFLPPTPTDMHHPLAGQLVAKISNRDLTF